MESLGFMALDVRGTAKRCWALDFWLCLTEKVCVVLACASAGTAFALDTEFLAGVLSGQCVLRRTARAILIEP